MTEDIIKPNEQLQITQINDRTQIVFKKALFKGKVNQAQVLQTLLIAAQMQGEYYITKLSRGSPLDPAEVKCLKELAEITKLQVETPQSDIKATETPQLGDIKASILMLLSEKNKDS